MTDRNEAKALLARAGVEINNALRRVETMDEKELKEVVDMTGSIRAFFDKNGSCGAASIADLKAFFDKNGSCAGHAVDLETALHRVLKR